MKFKYKDGDKLICIDNNNGHFPLTIGKEYTVSTYNQMERGVLVTNDKGVPDTFYYADRFKPVFKNELPEDLFEI
jgi:hypothetical protein